MYRWLLKRMLAGTGTAFRYPVLWLGIAVLAASCSQYSNRTLPVAYHNLTARYNAYLIARDHLRQIDNTLFKQRKENYNQILPILLPLDSVALAPLKPQLEDAIRKASMVAERHQNSKWLDDSYVLLGRARLLRQDYLNATEVFKYVNTKGKGADEKHLALILLMRTYIEQRDFSNALNVAEYVRVQPLSKDNTRDYYLTKAYLHQQKGELATAAAILDATFPYLSKSEATARLHLITGQLYDRIGKPGQALPHFQAVLRNRPSYEQAFYAGIYTTQNDPKATPERFARLLNDRKNADLQDKIYFTMGRQEVQRGNFAKAVQYFQQSIQATTTNTAQIPYTYLELARLHDEKIGDLVKAKAYYDSSLAQLPPQSAEYAALSKRKNVLDEYVTYRQTIQLEDSLQRLASLNPAALDQVLDQIVRQKADQAQQEEARRKAAAARVTNQPATSSDLPPNERWSLYNPTFVSQGKMEFAQRWGNRPLEDNWRRSTKESANTPVETVAAANAGTAARGDSSAAGQAAGGKPATAEKEALYAAIPFSREALQASSQRLEDAYYRLGKLYKFGFNEPEKAIPVFETLLTRFPRTPVRPEVYYLLHVSNDQLGKASTWKEKLLQEFPASSYARQLGKISAATQNAGNAEQAQQVYTQIYSLYQANRLTEALAQAETAMSTLAGSVIEDKLALLRILLIGKVRGADPYRQALNEFVRDYPTSPLLPRVREMMVAADSPSAKRK